MAITWQAVSGDFNDKLWDLLKALEAPKSSDRLNLHFVGATNNPTIGVGFDLWAGGLDVRVGVYKGMGLKGELLLIRDAVKIAALTTEAKKELSYLNQLEAAIKAGGKTTLQSKVDAIMAARKTYAEGNPAYSSYLEGTPRSTFTFGSDTEVQAVLSDLWSNKYREALLSG